MLEDLLPPGTRDDIGPAAQEEPGIATALFRLVNVAPLAPVVPALVPRRLKVYEVHTSAAVFLVGCVDGVRYNPVKLANEGVYLHSKFPG
jgi:hypothetical protein